MSSSSAFNAAPEGPLLLGRLMRSLEARVTALPGGSTIVTKGSHLHSFRRCHLGRFILQRIGALLDYGVLGLYLVLLGGFIAPTHLNRNDRPFPLSLQAFSTWSTDAIQFLTGGSFSAYVIYYTRSASLTTASLFLLVLIGLLVV